MTIKLTINNVEQANPAKVAAVTVVTVDGGESTEQRTLIAPGEAAEVSVGPGQFVMVEDQSDLKES